MGNKLHIAGGEVLERWGAAPYQLVNAMLSRKLVAVDLESGNEFVAPGLWFWSGTVDCFYCPSRHVDCACPIDEYNRWCDEVCPEMLGGARRVAFRAETAINSFFRLADVEAYEQAHGLGPIPHKPETAEALAETLRAAGIEDAGMIARMVMAVFPMTERKLGALMRGEKDDDSNESGNVKAARRLLGKSK